MEFHEDEFYLMHVHVDVDVDGNAYFICQLCHVHMYNEFT